MTRYPEDFRKCSQVCGAPLGTRCMSRSGKIVDGRPDQVVTLLDEPHKARKLRKAAR